MSGLRLGERQVVEIARALSDEARVLILDEPTAALSNDETIRLFEFINRLRARGAAMIYITHRLDEVRQIADDVVVLRDGNLVLEAKVGERSRAELVEAMVGTSVDDVGRPVRPAAVGAEEPRLVLRAATSGRAFTDVDLDVSSGEVVALYGKVGSGIVEVAEAVFGLRPLTSGSAHVLGRPAPAHPHEAVTRGIGFLPADRKQDGAFMVLSCARNLSAPTWARQAIGHTWLTGRGELQTFERWRKALRIRVAPGGATRPIGTLSGGNQQKVLLARWLHAESQLLVLIEPTRGVDVGARQEIYATVRKLAQSGVAVLVASSDYEEVVQLADRAAVMVRGRLVRHLDFDAVTMRTLTDAAGG
jgi:ribose transport system ATP-binding protein